VVDAARLRRARNRIATGRTLLEGPHLIAAARSSGAEMETIFALEGADGSDVLLVTPAVLEKISDTKSPRGPIAVMKIPESAEISTGNLVVLHELSDPGNLGTVIRSAAAFGFGVIVVGGADPWSPKVLRSGAGAHFLTQIEYRTTLTPKDLSDRGFFSVGSVVRGGSANLEAPSSESGGRRRLALWIGSEAHGLGADFVEAMDALVTIDMPGDTESLNAAVAASILMHGWAAKGSRPRLQRRYSMRPYGRT